MMAARVGPDSVSPAAERPRTRSSRRLIRLGVRRLRFTVPGLRAGRGESDWQQSLLLGTLGTVTVAAAGGPGPGGATWPAAPGGR